MVIETNPFRETVTEGTDPITSITVVSNLDWLVVPEVILGPAAIIDLNASEEVPALKVFGTGAGIGAPSMISLLPGHIPNIEISQVNGLQGAVNSLVKTLDSDSDALDVQDNGVGDYTLSPKFGDGPEHFAIGSDERFPASVTGLRKGAGAGSADTAAVALTDYWDDTEFTGAGTIGLVPDPVAETGKYLKDDGTWGTPAGTGTVTSIGLILPAAVFNISGSPVTTSGDITITFDNQTANTIFAGPTSGGAAAPTFRAAVFADVSPLVGTGASNIAVGNDTRFPASVTGLRKGAGAGSSDTAAVAGVDYAAAAVFGGKGPSHSKGLVPDPGAGSSPYVRYLRDDGSWQTFVPDAGTLINSMLATMPAKTLKANATAGVASPTDVTAKTARSSALLNLESQTTFGNTDYTALATDRHVVTSANLTAIRTVTLPLANSFNPGQPILIADDFGAINGAFILKVSTQGGDTIQGSSADLEIDVKYGSVKLDSDGVNQWNVTERSPSVRVVVYESDDTYTPPPGVKAILVEGIGGGGGGGGAVGGAGLSAATGGAGGAYGRVLLNSPSGSYIITIGAGGLGGAAGANDGLAGGASIFGAVLRMFGGLGGTSMTNGSSLAINSGENIAGGISDIGDFGADGSYGGAGIRLSGTVGQSGHGGAPPYLGSSVAGRAIAETDGFAASKYGGGGAGALSLATDKSGGDGSQGVIIITEYY